MKRISLDTVTDCTDCGACCMEMRSPPFVGIYVRGPGKGSSANNAAEARIVPSGATDHFGDVSRIMSAPEEARRVYLEGLFSDRPNQSPCSWFDAETKQCRWYEHRPDVCRNGLDVGSSGCLHWRRKFGISAARRLRMVNGRMVPA